MVQKKTHGSKKVSSKRTTATKGRTKPTKRIATKGRTKPPKSMATKGRTKPPKSMATKGKSKSAKKTVSQNQILDEQTSTKLKATFFIILGVVLVVFGAVLTILRSSIRDISQDPSLSSLTNDTTFKVVQIINRNKNLYEDDLKNCWNMKNPFDGCHEDNKIKRGNYVLGGAQNGVLIEGPYIGVLTSDIFRLSENHVRTVLGGFKYEDVAYYQIIGIDYPKENLMQVEVKTTTNTGDTASQTITIKGYPIE